MKRDVEENEKDVLGLVGHGLVVVRRVDRDWMCAVVLVEHKLAWVPKNEDRL